MGNKTLRGNVDILLAKDGAFANPHAPLVAELNNTNMVINISCAVNDEYDINLTSPDTDESISVCDISAVATPTFANYSVGFDIFRDEDFDATGVYNKAYAMTKHSGVVYWVIVRIGKAQGTPFAVGDIVSLFKIKTDYPADVLDAGSPMQLTVRTKPTGDFEVEYEVAA